MLIFQKKLSHNELNAFASALQQKTNYVTLNYVVAGTSKLHLY